MKINFYKKVLYIILLTTLLTDQGQATKIKGEEIENYSNNNRSIVRTFQQNIKVETATLSPVEASRFCTKQVIGIMHEIIYIMEKDPGMSSAQEPLKGLLEKLVVYSEYNAKIADKAIL